MLFLGISCPTCGFEKEEEKGQKRSKEEREEKRREEKRREEKRREEKRREEKRREEKRRRREEKRREEKRREEKRREREEKRREEKRREEKRREEKRREEKRREEKRREEKRRKRKAKGETSTFTRSRSASFTYDPVVVRIPLIFVTGYRELSTSPSILHIVRVETELGIKVQDGNHTPTGHVLKFWFVLLQAAEGKNKKKEYQGRLNQLS